MKAIPRGRLLLTVAAVGLIVSACGDSEQGSAADESGGANRRVKVRMVDIAFEPKEISVREGQTVTFTFENVGKLPHDAFVGDEAAQAEHEQEMRAADGEEKAGGHGGHGNDESAVTVEPGKSADLTYTFRNPGQIVIGCHQAGHYAAGMKVLVNVEPNP